MATGDIKAVAIRSDGWSADVTIEGWSGRQGVITYNFDVDGTPRMVFTVVSEGYNATGTLGTVTRTVYGTKVVRLAKPNNASLNEATSGSDLVVRVALSNDIYDDDKNGGAGTSGTNPTVTVAAGWATYTTPDPDELNNAVTALAVTNNSTLDYPVAFGQHDPYAGTLMRSRVKTDFPVAFNARHGEGIACVRWNATGGTSLHTQEAFATVQTATQRTATGLYACAYGATIPLAGYTQGELITVRVRAYPVVGDANSILDTNGRNTAENECLGWNDLVLTCDKNNTLDAIKYVSTTGNDTTGDGSSGNPWLTVNKAVRDSGTNIVRLMGTGTTYDLSFSGARRTTTEWIVVEANSGATPTVRLQSAASRVYEIQRLMFRGLPVTKTNDNSYLDSNGRDFLAFINCAFEDGGFTSGGNPGLDYQGICCYIINPTGDLNRTNWRLASFSTSSAALVLDGVPFAADDAASGVLDAAYRVVACSGTNQFFLMGNQGLNPAPTKNGTLFEFNRLLNNTLSGGNVLFMNGSTSNHSIIGNIIEKTAGSESAVHLWSDSTAADASHVILAHNTGVGTAGGQRRWNLFYNDRGTTPYTHKSVFFRGNHIEECNIKSDTFGHITSTITQTAGVASLTVAVEDLSTTYAVGQNIFIQGATQPEYNGTFAVLSNTAGVLTFAINPAAASPSTGTRTYFGLGRTGNWAQLFGVNYYDNNFGPGSSFPWENYGVGSTVATPIFANAGADDYGPATSSTLLNRARTPLYVPFDLLGRRLSVDSTAKATGGAVQPVPTLAVTASGTSVASGATVDIGPVSNPLTLVGTVGGLTGAVLVVDAGSVGGGISAMVPPSLPRTLTAGGSTTTATFTATLGVSPGTFNIGSQELADYTGTVEWTLLTNDFPFRARMGGSFRNPTGIRRR
jgi:hypothetical protein